MMEYFGLLFEILFFLLGIYLYLFARGIVRTGNPDLRKRAESFRASNAWWLRLLGLAIAAIMGLNIYLHLANLFGNS